MDQMIFRCTRPVKDADGITVLYDVFLNGRWVGSRRTVKQCVEEFKFEETRHAN